MIIGVSPSGNDEASGTPDEPVATLLCARERARRAIAHGLDEPLTVQLRGGVYRPAQTLALGPLDSGTADCPVSWRAFPGERPIISGGRPIAGWCRPDGPVKGLPPEAQEHVWVTDVPAGWRFSALFDSEGMLPRARLAPMQTVEPEGEASRTELRFEPGALKAPPYLADAELFITPRYPWVTNYLPLESVDEQQGIATTTIPGTYELTTQVGWGEARSWSVENVLEALTEPGEWVLDTQEGLLCLWPRSSAEPGGDIVAPAMAELVRIDGDFEGRDWAQHIALDGLTFTHGDRARWPADRQAVQHDWDLYDCANALVRLRGAEHVTVRNCRFIESGGAGVRLDFHAVDNRVACNEIAHLGLGGVSLVGYGPGDRDENHHNEVARNHIHDCGRLLWHCPAILLCQSGQNRIHNNLVYNMPYSGIVLVSGREGAYREGAVGRAQDGSNGRGMIDWDGIGDCPPQCEHRIGLLTCKFNVVEHNDIHHVMERLADGNGIYVSGTGAGNIVRRNYVHHIEGQGCQSGIRLDDLQWYSLVSENVVWRVSGGGFTLKDINDLENNIAVDCRRGGSVLVRRGPAWGSTVRRNIFVQSGLPMERPGAQPPFYDGGGFAGRLEEPVIEDNVLFCTESPEAAQKCLEAMRAIGKDTRSVMADPQFVDLDKGDFHLRPGSPALRLGFRPIERWGLTESVGPVSTDT